jgi:hypothetical protein
MDSELCSSSRISAVSVCILSQCQMMQNVDEPRNPKCNITPSKALTYSETKVQYTSTVMTGGSQRISVIITVCYKMNV